jgi:hypothetical protein
LKSAPLIGQAIRLATAPSFNRFLRAMEDPEKTQHQVLRRMICHASSSAYGRHHGLEAEDDLLAYQAKIPIAGYEAFRPWIERAVFDHEPGMLSPHPVVRVEATSGSSSAVKWIPYTRPMLRTFSRMFSLWAHDILRHKLYRPQTGKMFMCVTGGAGSGGDGSPVTADDGDDRAYLGKLWRIALDRFVVLPQFADSEAPLEMLAQSLASEPEIELMSFWSPSLLLSVLDHMGIGTAEEARQAWPDLQLVSCWTAGSSTLFIDRLRGLFPRVLIQGKGLLATEAAVTVPLQTAGGCVPLLQDVFLEFESGGGEISALHELQDGNEYEVILSTAMGLLRYRLGDRVRVTGFYRETPLLDFLGRAGITSDLVGEKLTLEFIEREIGSLVNGYFCLLPLGHGYELWIDAGPGSSLTADQAEERLGRSFHYHRAVQLGQLAPVVLRATNGLAGRIRECLEEENARPGVFKPPLLLPDPSLARRVSRELRRMPKGNMG